MWTETTRKKYARCGIRYASDMTDGEWRLIEPLLPSPRRLGRPRTTNLREVVNGGAKLVHPGGAKLVHLTLCGTRCWGVVPVVHRRVRIPTQSGHRFQSKAATDSDPKRPVGLAM